MNEQPEEMTLNTNEIFAMFMRKQFKINTKFMVYQKMHLFFCGWYNIFFRTNPPRLSLWCWPRTRERKDQTCLPN